MYQVIILINCGVLLSADILVDKFQYCLIWWCYRTKPNTEIKLIFQNLPFVVTQYNRVENWVFRNTSFSVLEYSIVEILSLIKEKFVTPVFSPLQYHFCNHNGNLLLVITFLCLYTEWSQILGIISGDKYLKWHLFKILNFGFCSA